MQTLSLKRKLKGLTIVGYFCFETKKVYKHKANCTKASVKANKLHNFKQIAKDCVNVEKAASLYAKIQEAKQAIKKGWSFAKYCVLASLYNLRKLFYVKLDKLSRAMLF